MSKKVLVIASHPDDEILGPGGTIKKLINDRYEVVTVIMTKGRKEEEHHLQKFALLANNHLGIKEVICLQYPTLKLDTFSLHEIIKEIEALLVKYKPKIIFTHHYGDINRDKKSRTR
jgi:LmbE family N-acetylglucosaminyl deacetylase